MKITEEMVEYISTLSRLKLEALEQAKMAGELETIVSYMDILNRLDTAEVEPLSHMFPVKNVTRPDEVQPSFPRADLLWNAPGRDEETFLVPKAVD
ncbi:Asp-tRNA(Asn)/Glu-tRNA(Gln) amidotransferase subunit GatC [Pseudoflavonifractor phocaeensis]|uniref:Asp-tRNA(Asn)/Glu-tRNA(Gln) amidotransferase subunit GatC n=1 Tax=Pseudoflavonifractor phocaeensis TaxID=1870988 RepID=UPI00313BC748